MFNLMLILAGMVRIFVYGEPSLCKVSAWSRYWAHRRQADREVGRGDGGQGGDHLVQAALCLGRPPPTSTLDSLASLLWQIILLLLDTLNLPTLVRRVMRVEERLVLTIGTKSQTNTIVLLSTLYFTPAEESWHLIQHDKRVSTSQRPEDSQHVLALSYFRIFIHSPSPTQCPDCL